MKSDVRVWRTRRVWIGWATWGMALLVFGWGRGPLAPVPGFAAEAVLRLTDVVREGDGIRFRVQGAGRYRVEVSTNLTVWEGLGEREAVDFTDAGVGGRLRRFYRVVDVGAVSRLRFLEPLAGALLNTNRPRLELETPALGMDQLRLRLTVNGADIPFEASLVVTGRVVLVPAIGLSDGWQTVVATLREGTNVAARAARTEFGVGQGGTNLPPVVRDDFVRVAGGELRLVSLLANDVDPEGGGLGVVEVMSGGGGEATIRDGGVVYAARGGFLGEDTFRYVVADAQGLRATGLVSVLVRPAADLTVVLADAPGAVARRLRFESSGVGAGVVGLAGIGVAGVAGVLEEYRSLDEAVAALCRALQPGQRGRIRVRARQPIVASRVWFECPIDIEGEEGHRPRIEGTAIEFGGGGSLALVGMAIGAGQTTLAVGQHLDLVGNVFEGDVGVRLNAVSVVAGGGGGVAAPAGFARRVASAVGAGDEVRSRGNAVRGRFEVTGDAGDGASIEHRGDNAAVIGFEGRVGRRGRYWVDGSLVTDRLVLRAQAEAGAEFEANGVVGVSALEHRLVANGEIATRVRGVVAGRAELELAGVGKVVGSVQAVRADRIDYRLGAAEIEHRGAGTVAGDVAIEIAPLAGTAVRANVSEDGLRLGGGMNLVTAEDVNAAVSVQGGVVGDRVVARLAGDATVRLGGGLAVGGDAYVEARGRVTRVESSDVVYGARFEARHESGVAAFLQFQRTVHRGDVEVGAAPTGTVGLDVAGAVFDGGARLVRAIGGGGRSPAGAAVLRTRGAGVALHGQATEQVVVRDTRFVGDATGPCIYLEGTRGSVLIEGCEFSGRRQAIVVNEPEWPVTIRGNRLAGEGLVVDGDVEGGGLAPGVRVTPVLIAGNEWGGVRLQPAIAVQDLSQVTVVSNVIRGPTGIVVTAGRAVLEGNELTLNSGMPAVLATRGPGGAAHVVARGNRITAVLGVEILDGSHGDFADNEFAGARVEGVTVPPLPPIPGLPGLPGLPGDGGGDGDEDEESEPNQTILVGDGVKLAVGTFSGNSFSNTTVLVRTLGYLRMDANRFAGRTAINVMGLFGRAQAEVRRNTFRGEESAIVLTGGLMEVVENRFSGLIDLGIAGPFAPALARIQGNGGGEVDLDVGLAGYTWFSGNAFDGGVVMDGEGYLLNDPGGNGVPGEEIQSKVNFDGDGERCRDYPSPQFCPVDGGDSPCCNGVGNALRSAPGGLGMEAWPAPPIF